MATPDKPSFTIDTEAELGAIREIDEFYAAIEQEPEIMKEAVVRYSGIIVLKTTVQKPIGETENTPPSSVQEETEAEKTVRLAHEEKVSHAKAKVRHFFENRLDREVEFDNETESALRGDEKYLELVEGLRKARSVPEAQGNSTGAAQSRENRRLRISEAQKNIAYYSLLFFVNRMAVYQNRTAATSPLQEAV